MATKKRPGAKHRGKDLSRSICATSAQWKVQQNKSLWGEYATGTTALEKCIDKSTLVCCIMSRALNIEHCGLDCDLDLQIVQWR